MRSLSHAPASHHTASIPANRHHPWAVTYNHSHKYVYILFQLLAITLPPISNVAWQPQVEARCIHWMKSLLHLTHPPDMDTITQHIKDVVILPPVCFDVLYLCPNSKTKRWQPNGYSNQSGQTTVMRSNTPALCMT